MSVLNQSGEEQVECPLCMEPLEVDDLNFFPCTCGYQICRFCWHRIRTDENGLCPACRKAYSENPADFIPLSKEQVAKLKAEKRQKDQQRKAKQSENRKHLANVRVVQRNLVFVVGLPVRLADPEVLKRHEYFGKFGKIHKVVINQSTSYAGSQGPSASAYVTYMKSDDALRAIQSVNNIMIDGRLIKSSLGTTKYCSHFLKNQTCPKPDCMYLHDYGDPEASFTKEEMHAGKHQEYEKKLHESLLNRTANNNNSNANSEPKGAVPIPVVGNKSSSLTSSKETAALSSSVSSSSSTLSNSSGTNKENWPNLNNSEKEKKEKEKTRKGKTKVGDVVNCKKELNSKKDNGGNVSKSTNNRTEVNGSSSEAKEEKSTCPQQDENNTHPPSTPLTDNQIGSSASSSSPYQRPKLTSVIDDNSSFFSLNSFQKITPSQRGEEHQTETEDSGAETTQASILTDTLPINSTEDWAAAFGFRRSEQNLENLNKREEINGLDRYANEFGPLRHDTPYTKGIESYSDTFCDMPSKLQANLMDMLNKKNGYLTNYMAEPQQQPPITKSSHNGLNGLDQNMSKLFMDLHRNQQNKEQPQQQDYLTNGFGNVHQQQQQGGYYNSGIQDRIILLQQRQLEEQLLNLGLKQGFGNGSNFLYQNGLNPQTRINGENGGYANLQNQPYNNVKQNIRNSEDDLGFDPFQETQKAFAELIASEQNHKIHNTGHVNGVIHNAGHLPPPPPGFVPSSTHMNSFGSKILPFLNMSSSQQQINGSTTQNGWSSNYNPQLQQQKNNSNTCNDWKVLDPAILTSSRHFPLANNVRDHYNQMGGQQIQNGPPLRPYDYATNNTTFSNFAQQLQQQQQNYNNFTQQNLSWFASDINSQISSPPGFRSSQTTKQQEC